MVRKERAAGRMCVVGEDRKEFEIEDGMDLGMNAKQLGL